MSQISKYTVAIETDENDEAFFTIPESMWEELKQIGWRHGDQLGYEAQPRSLKIKNIDMETRKK